MKVNTCCYCGKQYKKSNSISLLCPECNKAAEEKTKLDTLEENLVEKGLASKIDDIKVINHPQRYGGDTTYECIKVCQAWSTPEEYRGWLKLTAIKYLCRLGKKDEAVQEINKAIWYLNKLKETYEG